MWYSNTYQKHLCVVILLLGSMATLITISNKYNLNTFPEQNFTNSSVVEIQNEDEILNQNTNYYFNSVRKSYRNKFNIPQMQQNASGKSEFIEIYILGLFELSTKWGKRADGYSEMVAAHLAVKHVNDFQILPGYKLKLITNDTKVNLL